MRQAIIIVPVLFLGALALLGYLLYDKTQSGTACAGEQCENLTADQLADMAIEARTQ